MGGGAGSLGGLAIYKTNGVIMMGMFWYGVYMVNRGVLKALVEFNYYLEARLREWMV